MIMIMIMIIIIIIIIIIKKPALVDLYFSKFEQIEIILSVLNENFQSNVKFEKIVCFPVS